MDCSRNEVVVLYLNKTGLELKSGCYSDFQRTLFHEKPVCIICNVSIIKKKINQTYSTIPDSPLRNFISLGLPNDDALLIKLSSSPLLSCLCCSFNAFKVA